MKFSTATASNLALALSIANVYAAPKEASDNAGQPLQQLDAIERLYEETITKYIYVNPSQSTSNGSYITLDDCPTGLPICNKLHASAAAGDEQPGNATCTRSTSIIYGIASGQVKPTDDASNDKVSRDKAHDSERDFKKRCLSAHNALRKLHKDTLPLGWSDDVAEYAQKYADSYSCSGSLSHSNGPYGENLAVGFRSPEDAINAWYDEIQSYDYSKPGMSSSTGHFTQVVWKGTSKLGCGVKECGNGVGQYLICSYQDHGNVLGQFEENVQPLI